MSLINDALKRARQSPPRHSPNQPPLRPVAAPPVSVSLWLVPAIIVILIVGAIFLIGGAWAHHPAQSVDSVDTLPAKVSVAASPAVPAVPTVPAQPAAPLASTTPVVMEAPPPPANPPLPPLSFNPPALPVLQGIFYSPTQPSAIVNGQTVRPGDPVGLYRVKEISQSTVTLVSPDKPEIKLSLGH